MQRSAKRMVTECELVRDGLATIPRSGAPPEPGTFYFRSRTCMPYLPTWRRGALSVGLGSGRSQSSNAPRCATA